MDSSGFIAFMLIEVLDLVNPSTPRPEGRGLPLGLGSGRRLRVDPERRFFTPPSKMGFGAAEWVKEIP